SALYDISAQSGRGLPRNVAKFLDEFISRRLFQAPYFEIEPTKVVFILCLRHIRGLRWHRLSLLAISGNPNRRSRAFAPKHTGNCSLIVMQAKRNRAVIQT